MDDGSKSVEESIKMLESLADQGVDTVVLSSHFYADKETPEAFFKRRQESYETLKAAIADRDDLPELRLGAEVCYYIGISRMEQLSEFCIEGTSLVIIEPPLFCKWDRNTIDEIISLCKSGKAIVVIAHINRYFIYNKIEVFEAFAQAGALLQINTEVATSFREMLRLRKFNKRDLFHFIGSDCHNMTTRKPVYIEAVHNINKFLGPVAFERINYFEKTFIN